MLFTESFVSPLWNVFRMGKLAADFFFLFFLIAKWRASSVLETILSDGGYFCAQNM